MAKSFRWLRMDVDFLDHPKVRRLMETAGASAVLFHLSALFYCKRFETGGVIVRSMLEALTFPEVGSLPVKLRLASACEAVRLWDRIGETHWVIHNWQDYQYPGHGSYPGRLSTAGEMGYPQAAKPTRQREDISLEPRNNYSLSHSDSETTRAREHTGAREAAPCPECGMRGGRHLLECSKGTGRTEGASPFRQPCPLCGGEGDHARDCAGNVGHLTTPQGLDKDWTVMPNAARAQALRQWLRGERSSTAEPSAEPTDLEANE